MMKVTVLKTVLVEIKEEYVVDANDDASAIEKYTNGDIVGFDVLGIADGVTISENLDVSRMEDGHDNKGEH